MAMTCLLSKIFDLSNVEYSYIKNLVSNSIQHSWSENAVSLSNQAKITMLNSADSIILAICPASNHINLAKIVNIFKQPVYYSTISEISSLNALSLTGSINEIMSQYKIQIIIDIEVTDLTTILFKSDTEKQFLSVDSIQLEKLITDNPIGCQFSQAKPEFVYQPSLTIGAPRLNLMTKINNIKTLPILPEIAAQILQLQNDPEASVHSLSDIVAKDPALTSLILKYANSALFGLRGSVESVYDAILRVLGFDTVLHLSIGLAMGNSFKLDKSGPLGSRSIWQHAVFSAAICQKLSQKCPVEFRPSPGQAYLAGLLHDIGYLVLASSFETEYFWLNKLIASKPEVPMTVIEHQLLGVHHSYLGCILLTSWNMPEFLSVTVAEHHNEDYLGPYSELSSLVLLVDRALKSHSQSDAFTEILPEELVSRLGLSHDIITESVNEVLECSENLDLMVAAMSA
ncbi:hypothetical protein MNBD_GAMMA22-2409 [hydrothermal vent metagenome]|uniref:HDOD domain-containing protein n=1 Tax=hydrothermal vent metagenome TaxID=652676 RepID=A0A3B0ZLX3_9ZZZZ